MLPSVGYSADETNQERPLPEICQRQQISCLSGQHSLIIGPTEQIKPYQGLIEESRERYSQFFKAEQVNTVLFLASSVSDEDRAILRSAGYKVLLPWVSDLARQEMARGAIRAQVSARNADASTAEIDSMTEAMLERAGLAINVDVERGAISHELAHMWFIQGNWPHTDVDETEGNDDERPAQYGSGAPDWLDEMSAVLSENEFLSEQRRQTTKEIVKQGDLAAFWPLKKFFTMEHPIFRQTVAMLKARGDLKDGMNIVMLTGEQARGLDPEDGRESPHFYAQSRSFADFMIETSNSPYIFDEIAGQLGSGVTMAQWLSKAGEKHGLATTIPALQNHWEAWLLEG